MLVTNGVVLLFEVELYGRTHAGFVCLCIYLHETNHKARCVAYSDAADACEDASAKGQPKDLGGSELCAYSIKTAEVR